MEERTNRQNTCTPDPRARERHRGEHSSQGGLAEDRRHCGRFGGANTKGEAPANTLSMHSVEGHLKVLGSGENDGQRAGRCDGRSQRQRGKHRDGRVKSDSKTVNRWIEKKGRKNFALRNARVDSG